MLVLSVIRKPKDHFDSDSGNTRVGETYDGIGRRSRSSQSRCFTLDSMWLRLADSDFRTAPQGHVTCFAIRAASLSLASSRDRRSSDHFSGILLQVPGSVLCLFGTTRFRFSTLLINR